MPKIKRDNPKRKKRNMRIVITVITLSLLFSVIATFFYYGILQGSFEAFTNKQIGNYPFTWATEIETQGPNPFFSHADVYVAMSSIYPNELSTYAKTYASLVNTTDSNEWIEVPFCDETTFNKTAFLSPVDNPLWVNIGRISLANFNTTIYIKAEFGDFNDTQQVIQTPTSDPMKAPIEHIKYHLVHTPQTTNAIIQIWALFFTIFLTLIGVPLSLKKG